MPSSVYSFHKSMTLETNPNPLTHIFIVPMMIKKFFPRLSVKLAFSIFWIFSLWNPKNTVYRMEITFSLFVISHPSVISPCLFTTGTTSLKLLIFFNIPTSAKTLAGVSVTFFPLSLCNSWPSLFVVFSYFVWIILSPFMLPCCILFSTFYLTLIYPLKSFVKCHELSLRICGGSEIKKGAT